MNYFDRRLIEIDLKPYATCDDALAVAKRTSEKILPKPLQLKSHVFAPTQENSIPGLSDANVFTIKAEYSSGPLETRVVSRTLGEQLLVMLFSGYPGQWNWQDIAEIANRQMDKLANSE